MKDKIYLRTPPHLLSRSEGLHSGFVRVRPHSVFQHQAVAVHLDNEQCTDQVKWTQIPFRVRMMFSIVFYFAYVRIVPVVKIFSGS